MKKLIAGITTTALIASLSAPAFAANFGDVAGTKYEKSTALLKALNVVNGDVDGKYNPNDELTRAEFAKVAVRLAGLGAAADATGVHATPFADVQDGDWFAGYVQVAKDAGLVNGVGYGMFAPNDKVRYEEVLAVVERILGYSDKLQGNWPTKYVIKGTELKLYDNTSFGVGKNITRGDVALIVKAALNTPVVTYSTDLNQFVTTKDPNAGAGSTISLISKNFGTAVSSGNALTNASTLAGSSLIDGQVTIDGSNYALASDVTVVGGATAADLVGRKVQYVLDGDGNVAYLADVTSSTKVVTGTTDVASTATIIRVNGKDYTLATGTTPAQLYKNWSVAVPAASNVVDAGDTVTLILDAAGNAMYVVANHVQDPVIANEIFASTSVSKGYINLVTDGTQTTPSYTLESTTKYTLNGNAATLADIKAGDVLYATIGGGKVVRIDAYRNTVTVTADSFATKDGGLLTSITAGSTTYKVNGVYSIDASAFKTGDQYTLTIDKDGLLENAVAVKPASNDMLVLSIDNNASFLKDNQVLPGTKVVFLDNAGNKVTKFIEQVTTGGTTVGSPSHNDKVDTVTASTTAINASDYGSFTLDSDGLVSGWTEESSLANGNIKTDSVNADAKTFVLSETIPVVADNQYTVTDKTVFYDVYAGLSAVKVAKFSNLVGGTGKTVKVVRDPKDLSKALSVLIQYDTGITDTLTQQSGVYAGRKSVTTADSTTPVNYVTLNVNGTNVDYKIENYNSADFTNIAKGDLVKLTDSGNGIYETVAEGVYGDTVTRTQNVANAVYFTNATTGTQTHVVYDNNTKVYIVKYVGDLNTANRDAAVMGSLNDVTSLIGQASSTKFKFEVTTKSTNVAGYPVADAIVVYVQK